MGGTANNVNSTCSFVTSLFEHPVDYTHMVTVEDTL